MLQYHDIYNQIYSGIANLQNIGINAINIGRPNFRKNRISNLQLCKIHSLWSDTPSKLYEEDGNYHLHLHLQLITLLSIKRRTLTNQPRKN
jgi:hypothetical protein